jgi:hypothetical protein
VIDISKNPFDSETKVLEYPSAGEIPMYNDGKYRMLICIEEGKLDVDDIDVNLQYIQDMEEDDDDICEFSYILGV